MATKTEFALKGKSRDSYLDLVSTFPLASIQSEKHRDWPSIALGMVLACGLATALTRSPTSAAETPSPDTAKTSTTAADRDASADREGFSRAINHARAALVARDWKLAARQLDLADQHAQTPEHKAQARRFRALHAQLGLFFDAVRAGLKKIEPTEELDLGETIAAVVEVGPDSLALFIEGSRRDYTLATLPARVALLVAKGGADQNAPPAQVFWGAFHAVDPQGNRDTARQLWQAAARAGQAVDDLLPFLRAAELALQREPVPEPSLLAAAEKHLREDYASDIEAAKTSQRKSALALALIGAAQESETSDLQYALLTQAVGWAASAADVQPVVQAIDELEVWFEVDALALKSAALSAAVKASTTRAAAKPIAAAALDLADRAEADGRRELTHALSDTAYAAAQKARDVDLLKRATRRRGKLDPSPQKSSKSKASPAND
jgi:hypothetical protein